MDVKTAIELVDIWKENWPSKEADQAPMQQALLSLSKEASAIGIVESYERTKKIEARNAMLERELKTATDALNALKI